MDKYLIPEYENLETNVENELIKDFRVEVQKPKSGLAAIKYLFLFIY